MAKNQVATTRLMARHRRRLFLCFSLQRVAPTQGVMKRLCEEQLPSCWGYLILPPIVTSMTIGFFFPPLSGKQVQKKSNQKKPTCVLLFAFQVLDLWTMLIHLYYVSFVQTDVISHHPQWLGKEAHPFGDVVGIYKWIEPINKFAPFHWNDATTLDHLVYFLSNPISTAFSIHCSSKDFEYVRMDLGQYFQCLYYTICMCQQRDSSPKR